MDEGHPEFVAAAHSFLASFVVVRAVQNNFCAITLRGRDLDERRRQGHDDLRANAVAASVIRHALRMISRRRSDDAVRTLLRSER